jgi:hypothetical protein
MIEYEFPLLKSDRRVGITPSPIRFQHPFLNIPYYNVDLLRISYNKSDIAEDVFMRTSMIARRLVNEKTGDTQIDTATLTYDEVADGIFDKLFADAVGKVYERLSSFTHGLRGWTLRVPVKEIEAEVRDKSVEYPIGKIIIEDNNKYEVISEGNKDKEITDLWYFYPYNPNKLEIWIRKYHWFNTNICFSFDNAIREAIISYILYKWYELVVIDQYSQRFYQEFQQRMVDILNTSNEGEKSVRRKYKMF